MELKRRTHQKLQALLIVCSLLLCSGCLWKNVVLHPIEKRDIVEMKAGEPYTPEKDGWFLSDDYVEEVMKARIK